MRPSTEEFLYILLWTADTLARPTWSNAQQTFESWAWRHGLGRRIHELENARLLERAPGESDAFFVRLTEAGRMAALGGRDPWERWARPWDNRWRMLLFDLPRGETTKRMRLWRFLRQHHFGYLQHSAWVTPDLADEIRATLKDRESSVESLVLIEGHPAGGESDADIVLGAWNFQEINEEYEHYMTFVSHAPRNGGRSALRHWLRAERQRWNEVVRMDPLLPRALWPAKYLGEKALEIRTRAVSRVAAAAG